jgi:hypothetical protein
MHAAENDGLRGRDDPHHGIVVEIGAACWEAADVGSTGAF